MLLASEYFESGRPECQVMVAVVANLETRLMAAMLGC
jgi:hypothetical protein